MTQKTLLRGGDVLSGERVIRADILIDGERIAAVGPELETAGAVVVDVEGLMILPGLIDVHTHLREPGATHKEDFASGTAAALAGGVTTVFAMPNTDPPITSRKIFEQAAALAEQKAMCDVGLFVGATPQNVEEAAGLSDRAVGLKMYMGSSTGSLLVDDFASQMAHFAAYPRGRVIAVHAEDEEAVQYYAALGEHRPPICAMLGTSRALALATEARQRLHVCHVSTPYELSLIGAAKEHGLDVTCEAGPQHLLLNDEDWSQLGALGKVNPPLRNSELVAEMWAGLDMVDMIATDHAPHTLAEKQSDAPPSGLPGLETSLPLLLDAYHAGRLTLADIVRLTSSAPAKAFGLARKGQVASGFDADLTLIALNEEWTIRNDDLLTRCGWSPFAGRTIRGRVRGTYVRGRLCYEEGAIRTDPGSGQLVSPN